MIYRELVIDRLRLRLGKAKNVFVCHQSPLTHLLENVKAEK